MADKESDKARRLKQTLKAGDEGSQKKQSGSQAMDDMLKKSGLSKNVARSEKVAKEAASFLATHTVASGETLSHIAQKYYGSAARDDWMAIYEANKATIGDNPSLIKPGQELNIPRR